ncbi:MAG: propionyl-CoA carboxylase [Rickettsiales bacterium]|nr:propionyl-CoA carboxylase [Rickettsiales bacterium]|tara:strand:- start:757 stop:2742 length:1986 start_codon:yes stop_codon:yes gene_type:complete
MFDSVLIANRGEIAIRIMQTAKRMGMRTIAVYSEADTNALHVRQADEAVYIGPSPASQSYLNMEALLTAIDRSGAQCVHPGYGFLSENEEFCKAVRKMGVAWVGPGPDAIHKMGDKIESKKIANAAGVNTVPGVMDAIADLEKAKQVASEIGYPVMIKAAAGGGGKGMRVARSEADLEQGMGLASSEAKSSFGDARVFIEKFFDDPRHIEIQILADQHGNVLSLGERECSIQRRHQKVIEEAPSSFVTPEMREEMSRQSIQLAKEVGYASAGTVEYIVDQDGKFYFLEMNTRLQVEHRVTELVTGIDLVEQMFRVAAGEALSFTQEEVKLEGWAFESRIYAEDPARGFLPSTGRVTRYQTPESNGKLVIDTGVYEGGEVSMFYDPMIAKFSTHGATRDAAIEIMRSALNETILRGIAHNIPFLDAVLGHERFQKGEISTNFIEQEYPAGFAGDVLDSEAKAICMAVAIFCFLRNIERATQISGQLPHRKRAIGQRWVVSIGKSNYPVYVRAREHGYDIGYDSGLIVIRSSWKLGNPLFQGTVNGMPVSVKSRSLAEGHQLSYAGYDVRVVVREPNVAELAQYMPEPADGVGDHELVAPITGLVTKIFVTEGQEVREGQPLCIIEAMKMENILYADHDATIEKVHVSAPGNVSADEVLLTFA